MIRYIVPDWDDIIDPGYDFEGEEPSPEYRRDRYRYGARIWEVFDPPPVDGVLVSISTVKAGKWRLIKQLGGARELLKLPRGLQLIGDCGAWQYRNMEAPPYTVEEVLRLYDELGVDYGVTLDHIPLFGDPPGRMRLTLENAIKSYELWKPRYERGDYRFELMASIQGVEIQDYLRMFSKLYDKGYRSFAVGGLAKRATNFIERLVGALRDELSRRRDVERIHFLGVARVSTIPALEGLDTVGEVSFDNATFLRMAWTRSVGNYVLPDGRVYTAIRVMNADEGLYELLRMYSRGEAPLDRAVEALREHLLKAGDLHYLPYYAATLSEKPWDRCDCPICRSAGIEVLIFKGNNRNRRRGFHNVYVFRRLLRGGALKEISLRVVKYVGETVTSRSGAEHAGWNDELRDSIRSSRRVLVLTHCTAAKKVDWSRVSKLLAQAGLRTPSLDVESESVYREVLRGFIKPASEMYGGTFASVKNLVKALRRCGKTVDFLIVSARYGIIRESDAIIPYDATLKGMSSREISEWSARRGVGRALIDLARGPYDLAVVILPKEYLIAVRDALELLPASRIILISARGASRCSSRVKCFYLPGSSLPRRLKYVKQLAEMCEELCTKKLTEIAARRQQDR